MGIEIDNAIEKHKNDCQKLQDEKFKNITNSLSRMEDDIKLLLKQNNVNAVLETRLNIVEAALNKRTDKTIGIISFVMSILLALYVLLPKIIK